MANNTRTHIHILLKFILDLKNKNKYAARLTSDHRIRVKVGSLVTRCGSVIVY